MDDTLTKRSLTQLINDGGDCRTALATSGLLNRLVQFGAPVNVGLIRAYLYTFVCQNDIFMFLLFLPILIPIVKLKMPARVEMTFINSNILKIGSYHHTK